MSNKATQAGLSLAFGSTLLCNKGQKLYGPNRSRRYEEQVARIHRRTIQKNLHDSDNYDGVITHLEPDILECEVKWALESITVSKASRGDAAELSQI